MVPTNVASFSFQIFGIGWVGFQNSLYLKFILTPLLTERIDIKVKKYFANLFIVLERLIKECGMCS